MLQNEISPTYYRDHFWRVVDGVESRHGFLLAEDERDYIKTLRALSTDAVSLYIRLVNRKGPYFRINKLVYEDITCIKTAIDELQNHNLVFTYQIGNQIDTAIYNCFNQKELYQLLKGHTFKRFARKAELHMWLENWDDVHSWLAQTLIYEPVIHLSPQNLWPFLKFIFFGELTENLSGFVIKELGHVVNENFKTEELKALFNSRSDLESAYKVANLYNQFRILREKATVAATYCWWQGHGMKRENLADIALNLFDRLVGKLGRLLERKGENEMAAELYATSPVAPSRERLARLKAKAGKLEFAKQLCREMIANPSNSEEAYAGKQLLTRWEKTKRRSDAREMLNNGQVLQLDYVTGYAEHGVIEYYETQGWHGIHSENWLWNNLFGLLFWDIIYDTSYGSFNQPLQFAPSDLYKPEFYVKRQDAFEARLRILDDIPAALVLLHETCAAKINLANPFVSWHENLLPMLETLISHVPANGLKAIMRRMCMNLKLYRRGFPDLFLWNDDGYKFVEVKSATDQISPQQYHWLKFFAENGVNCEVQRVYKTEIIAA